MDQGPDGSPLPTVDELRHTLSEQSSLLSGPALPEVVQVRVARIARTLEDLLAIEDVAARGVATRAIAWTAESVGAFQRLPARFRLSHAGPGTLSPALTLIDELDLLGLTLDHTYDALTRGDRDVLARQEEVLRDRFGTDTEPVDLVEEDTITPEDLDQDVVEVAGLEVGEDGIPRLPVPEQPDPHHEAEEA